MSGYKSHVILQKKGLVNLYTMLQNIAAKNVLKDKFTISEEKVYVFTLPKQFQVFNYGAPVDALHYTFDGKDILKGGITIRLNEDLKKKHIVKVIELPDWSTRDKYTMTGNLPASAVSLDMHLSQDSIIVNKKNTAPVLKQNLFMQGYPINSRPLKFFPNKKTIDGEAFTYMQLQITIPTFKDVSEPIGRIFQLIDNDKYDDIKSIDVMVFDIKDTKNPEIGYKRTYYTTPLETELHMLKIDFKLPDVFGGKDITIYEVGGKDIPLKKQLPLKHYVFSKTQWPYVELDYNNSGSHGQKGIVPVSPMRLLVRDYNGGGLVIDVDLQFK